MSDAGRVGSIERVEGGQSRIGSCGAGWWRVWRERVRSSRKRVGSMVLARLIQYDYSIDEAQYLIRGPCFSP